MSQLFTPRLIALYLFIASACYAHFRGRVRHKFFRQVTDHSTFFAPVNALMYVFSRVPTKPFTGIEYFPQLRVLDENWQIIRDEGMALQEDGRIRASDKYDDAGFNSFFRRGWKRFYLKWYGSAHPSALASCPQTVALLKSIPSVKAAMFAYLPAGGHLGRHRDPYAGSLRYHLGLSTPNSDACFIEVDGERYSWRDGQSVVFDETYIHWAENGTEQDRLILFCDVERPLTFAPISWFNKLFSRLVMAASASPNEIGDKTGWVNRLFGVVYKLRVKLKALKKSNRRLYYLIKLVFFGTLFYLVFFA